MFFFIDIFLISYNNNIDKMSASIMFGKQLANDSIKSLKEIEKTIASRMRRTTALKAKAEKASPSAKNSAKEGGSRTKATSTTKKQPKKNNGATGKKRK